MKLSKTIGSAADKCGLAVGLTMGNAQASEATAAQEKKVYKGKIAGKSNKAKQISILVGNT